MLDKKGEKKEKKKRFLFFASASASALISRIRDSLDKVKKGDTRGLHELNFPKFLKFKKKIKKKTNNKKFDSYPPLSCKKQKNKKKSSQISA